jgi:hypothetical protein
MPIFQNFGERKIGKVDFASPETPTSILADLRPQKQVDVFSVQIFSINHIKKAAELRRTDVVLAMLAGTLMLHGRHPWFA